MNSTFTLTMALLSGLTGSLHCAGMCGPIIWVMPFQAFSGWKKWLGIGLYHFGRISVYAGLAGLLYSFRSLFHPQWQQYISVILGSILLLVGLITFFPGRIRLEFPWNKWLQQRLGHYVAHPRLHTLMLAGGLNGLLPCGLVYMALSASMAAPDAFMAVEAMYVFGLGTLPMLITITMIRNRIRMTRIAAFRKVVPFILFGFGCLFIVRGMNLGIPYLSPKIIVEKDAIRADCCHKR